MLYGIDQRRLDMMKDDAIIMHPGPINRGVELMPEAAEIGQLRLQGLKDDDIADIIGVKRTTFRSRIEKARAKLREEYGEDFYF